MRKKYNFANSNENSNASHLTRQVTIRLDKSTIDYFQDLAGEAGIPYQTLLNPYLRECAGSGKTRSTNRVPASS